jgi:hypothetical protein
MSDTIRSQLVATLAGAEKRLKEAIKALPLTAEVKALKKVLREHDSLTAYLAANPLIAAVEDPVEIPPPESGNGVAKPEKPVEYYPLPESFVPLSTSTEAPKRRKTREEAGA